EHVLGTPRIGEQAETVRVESDRALELDVQVAAEVAVEVFQDGDEEVGYQQVLVDHEAEVHQVDILAQQQAEQRRRLVEEGDGELVAAVPLHVADELLDLRLVRLLAGDGQEISLAERNVRVDVRHAEARPARVLGAEVEAAHVQVDLAADVL